MTWEPLSNENAAEYARIHTSQHPERIVSELAQLVAKRRTQPLERIEESATFRRELLSIATMTGPLTHGTQRQAVQDDVLEWVKLAVKCRIHLDVLWHLQEAQEFDAEALLDGLRQAWGTQPVNGAPGMVQPTTDLGYQATLLLNDELFDDARDGLVTTKAAFKEGAAQNLRAQFCRAAKDLVKLGSDAGGTLEAHCGIQAWILLCLADSYRKTPRLERCVCGQTFLRRHGKQSNCRPNSSACLNEAKKRIPVTHP